MNAERTDHAWQASTYVKVIVAPIKRRNLQYLERTDAVEKAPRDRYMDWASTGDAGDEPDEVMRLRGRYSTFRSAAAAAILSEHAPGSKVLTVLHQKWSDLLRLRPDARKPARQT